MVAAPGAVPVIAVTGRLGAGKTTLLNHLLRTPGARLGVVINDFGTLNVDAGLVTGQVDEAAAISGGCLCCLPDAGGLDDALAKLAQPKLRLDAIIVEASGVADPRALARLIRLSAAPRTRLGGLIEVVDAANAARSGSLDDEAVARFRAATLVVLGKADLLPPEDRADVLARLRAHVAAGNPHVPVLAAERGRIDAELVFDVASLEEPADELPIARLLREAALEETGGHHHHGHADVASASLPVLRPIAARPLLELLEQPPAATYRIKGRVRVEQPGRARGYLVNVVGGSVHVAEHAVPEGAGELVVIGAGLDAAEAEERLRAVVDAHGTPDDAEALRLLRRYARLSA